MAKVYEISDHTVGIIHPDQTTEAVDRSRFDFTPQIGDEITISSDRVYFVSRGSNIDSGMDSSSSADTGDTFHVNQTPDPNVNPQPFVNVSPAGIKSRAKAPGWLTFKLLVGGIIATIAGVIILIVSGGSIGSLCELANVFGQSDSLCTVYSVAKVFGYVFLLGGAGLLIYALYGYFKNQEKTLPSDQK
jgi:hypothetical protein